MSAAVGTPMVAPVIAPVTPRASPAAAGRIESLDGLRGVAALIVVAFHTVMTLPSWADAYRYGVLGTDPLWWVTHTPLHLLWAGREAVLVFFVLSGLVLTLPAMTRPVHIPGFHIRRLVRLLLPVWAAVALAAVWAVVVPRRWPGGASWWVHAEGGQLSWDGLLRDLTLVIAPGDTLHPLWSLQWELLFCLSLPALLLAAPAARRRPAASSAVLLALLAGGVAADQMSAVALACFAAGGLLAVHADPLTRTAARLNAHPAGPVVWSALTVAALGLLAGHWMVQSPDGPLIGPAVTRAGQAVGAGLLVVVAWLSPAAVRVLTRPLLLWLGTISFSLYLVHYPVVMSLAATGVTTEAQTEYPVVVAALLVVTAGTTLSLAAVFHYAVERPAHRLAGRAGRWVTAATPAEQRAASGPWCVAVPVVVLAALLCAAAVLHPAPHPDPLADLPDHTTTEHTVPDQEGSDHATRSAGTDGLVHVHG